MTQSTEEKRRAEYVAGLRAIADLIEANPDLPLPLVETFAVFCDKDDAIKWVRVLPGDKPKDVNHDESYMLFGKDRDTFGPFGFRVWVERGQVCERVVTGQRTVTRTVPTATEEVTVTEDVVEWVCSPLLADAVSA